MRTFIRRGVAVAALVVALPLAGHANEGFWPFNRIPRAAIKRDLGVDLSDAWIQRVQQASVRFPSGSGSFVSPDGLVLTNHHVSLDLLHKLSTPERDYASKGFTAADRSQEMKAADLELMSLQKIEDVTAKVNEAVKPGMSSAETLAARRSAIAAIEKDSQDKTGLDAEVVTLYQGRAVSPLSLQKIHRRPAGVRAGIRCRVLRRRSRQLHLPTLLPRHDDLARLRERQAVPDEELPAVVDDRRKEGDAVFTSGHPGATQRLNTVAHLEFLRDYALPLSINAFTQIRNRSTRTRSRARAGAPGERRFLRHRESLKSWKGRSAA
jgi:hypothetical protein